MVHIQMHLCFIFSFHNYIFKFNDVLNNTLFMFWNMNINLELKFVIYTFYLQIVAILVNWKDMSSYATKGIKRDFREQTPVSIHNKH
jgi:hypothetical protein